MVTKEEESAEKLFNRQADEIQKLKGHLNMCRKILNLPDEDWALLAEERAFYMNVIW